MGARNRVGIELSYQPARVGNLSPAMGRGINSRNQVWNWVYKQHRPVGRYDNPMPTWFLAPIAGLKLPTQATRLGGIGSLEWILGLLKTLKIWALENHLPTDGKRQPAAFQPVWLLGTALPPAGNTGPLVDTQDTSDKSWSLETDYWIIRFTHIHFIQYSVGIAGHRQRGASVFCSGIMYLCPVPDHSGTRLGLLIPVPNWFRHLYFFTFQNRIDRMPDSPTFRNSII